MIQTHARERSASVVMMPGWQGSGPDHWQSIWSREISHTSSVEQDNWEDPNRSRWIESLDRAVLQQRKPVVLVAHSLGCLTVAHWAGLNSYPIVAAFLVAPPNVLGPDACCRAIQGFSAIPRQKLSFPSLVVASENDSYASIEWTNRLAKDWGSDFINVGRAGHINVQSGHGSWPEGRCLLARLMDSALRLPAGRVRADIVER
jgi:predicted alpha/beta hydrolase family esterase